MNYSQALDEIKMILATNGENIVDKTIEFLYEHFKHYHWIGVYIVKEKSLHLGPWRGKHPTEHVQIPIGKGICGSAAKTGKTEIIPDVKNDNRYLACFHSTRSEIVVPIKHHNMIIAEIDVDSDSPDVFTDKDKIFLEKIADMLSPHICKPT